MSLRTPDHLSAFRGKGLGTEPQLRYIKCWGYNGQPVVRLKSIGLLFLSPTSARATHKLKGAAGTDPSSGSKSTGTSLDDSIWNSKTNSNQSIVQSIESRVHLLNMKYGHIICHQRNMCTSTRVPKVCIIGSCATSGWVPRDQSTTVMERGIWSIRWRNVTWIAVNASQELLYMRTIL